MRTHLSSAPTSSGAIAAVVVLLASAPQAASAQNAEPEKPSGPAPVHDVWGMWTGPNEGLLSNRVPMMTPAGRAKLDAEYSRSLQRLLERPVEDLRPLWHAARRQQSVRPVRFRADAGPHHHPERVQPQLARGLDGRPQGSRKISAMKVARRPCTTATQSAIGKATTRWSWRPSAWTREPGWTGAATLIAWMPK